MTTEPQEPKRTPALSWLVPVAVIVLALSAIVLIFALNSNGGGVPPVGDAAVEEVVQEEVVAEEDEEAAPDEADVAEVPDLSAVERRDPSDVLAIGAVDAPVVLVVFSDFQCGYCAKWSAETLPELLPSVEAGDLRVEWRDVNIFGEPSQRAARAVYAAGMQGKFLEYHDALFEGGKARSESGLSEAALVALAADLGLDADQFAADMNSEATVRQIEENQALGLGLGVTSTPSFLLGGQPIVGAQPTEIFVEALNGALAAAG